MSDFDPVSAFRQPARDAGAGTGADISRLVADLLALEANDEACRLLGVDGVLEGQLDVSFLQDPLDWVASDIAEAIAASQSEETGEAPGLTTLVAELRLYRLLKRSVDDVRLISLVRDYLTERGV